MIVYNIQERLSHQSHICIIEGQACCHPKKNRLKKKLCRNVLLKPISCNFDVSKNVFTFKLFMKISFTKMRSYQFIIQSRSNSISSFNPCKHSFASKNSNQTFKHLCGSQWPSGLIRQFEKKEGEKYARVRDSIFYSHLFWERQGTKTFVDLKACFSLLLR